MTRLQFIVLSLLIASALSLVVSQHQTRRVFFAITKAQDEQKNLMDEWEKLQLQQTTIIKPAFIDQQAQQLLNMQSITPAKTLYAKVENGSVVIQDTELSGAAP